VIDLTVSAFHAPHALWARAVLLTGGVVGNGIATGLYIGAGLGPGARDGLTTGIASHGHSIRVVRTTIEAAVLATGFLLGGTVGIGTVFYALAIGPISHQTIPALAIDDRLRMLRPARRQGRNGPAADPQPTELAAGSSYAHDPGPLPGVNPQTHELGPCGNEV
jgi:uncharacterized membrane protein YczE